MTTPDKLAAERAAFESWADTQVGSTDSTKNQRSIIDAWRGWEARAALEAKPAEPVASATSAKQVEADFRGARRRDAAEATLTHLGYSWVGGELWKPPLGKPSEPVAYWFRHINTEGEPTDDWKPVKANDFFMQTVEDSVRELLAYRYEGNPCYEVMPLYAAPAAPSYITRDTLVSGVRVIKVWPEGSDEPQILGTTIGAAPAAPADSMASRLARDLRDLLAKIRRDAPDLSGKLMGECEATIRAYEAAPTAPADLCERICAAIVAEDTKSVDEAGYMLDSNDCCRIVREQFAAAPAAPAPLTLREQLDARTPWDELEAILPQNEQDAERYRWLAGRCARLAEHWGGQWAIFLSGPGPSEPSSREAVDAAIDAAIEANKKEKA
jgi:hypothetical protein